MNVPFKPGHKATIFKSNRSQAVRLPKAVAFPEDVKEVTVIQEGNTLRLVPTNALWDDFFAQPGIDIRIAEDVIEDAPAVRLD